MSFEEFQVGGHGGHLGYWDGTILAILNLYITPMPPIKFPLNLIYGLGGDVIRRFSRWPPWQPSWSLERNDFNNSESPLATMPHTKFQLNLTYNFGGDVENVKS